MNKCIKMRFGEVSQDKLFIIAECGNQFGGSKEKALRLIVAAKEAGADAVKFIFWYPDEVMADKEVRYAYATSDGLKTETMYDLVSKLRLQDWEWLEVRDYALNKKINFMSTIISPSGIDLANFLDLDAVKLSSWDYNFTELWKWCAQQGRPLFIDTGPVTAGEIDKNLSIVKGEGNEDVVLLHCFHTNRYDEANMMSIPYMRITQDWLTFDCLVGYSAADYNDELDTVAVSLGACVLEKRLTLSRQDKVLHDASSKEPLEFKEYVQKMHNIKASLGKFDIVPSPEDLRQRKLWFRRIVADTNISKGECITRDMLEAKRGETGISPERMWDFVGKRASRDISRNETITYDCVAEGDADLGNQG